MPWKSSHGTRGRFRLAERLSLTAAALVLASCGSPTPEGLTISAATSTTAPASSVPLPPPVPVPVEAPAATPPAAEPPPTRDPRTGCDGAYPTVCIPAGVPDLDCRDVPYARFQVLAPDPHRFDRNKDGVGCERN